MYNSHHLLRMFIDITLSSIYTILKFFVVDSNFLCNICLNLGRTEALEQYNQYNPAAGGGFQQLVKNLLRCVF